MIIYKMRKMIEHCRRVYSTLQLHANSITSIYMVAQHRFHVREYNKASLLFSYSLISYAHFVP